MIDRRSFLGRTFGLGLGIGSQRAVADPRLVETDFTITQPPADPALAEYERTLAGSDRLSLLGIPRCWSDVREGFHPVSPARVVIVPSEPWKLFFSPDCFERKDLKERIRSRFRIHEQTRGRSNATLPYSEQKLELILSTMNLLATYYDCADEFEIWAMASALREALGSTGFGDGFALLHQFQSWTARPAIVNLPTDWWLILFPGGFDWGAYDDKPVYWMLGAVFSPSNAGRRMRVWELMSRLGRGAMKSESDQFEWAIRLAQMDRVTAARTVNLIVASNLAK